MDYRQVKAIEKANKQRLLKVMSDNTGKAICETILSAYKDFERECARLDMKVNVTARRSKDKDIFEVANEIAKLTNQKIACINAKVIIDSTLDTLPHTLEFRKYYLEQYRRPPLWNERIENKKEQLFDAILKRYKTQELLNLICDSHWLMSEVRRKKKQLDKVNEEEKEQKA